MLNIKMQCCGLAILLVIIFIYVRQKKINLNTEKAFMRLASMVAIGITLDILSLVALKYSDTLSETVVNLACKAYISTLVLVAMCGLLYVYVDIYNQSPQYTRRERILLLVTLIEIGIIFALPIKKEILDPNNTYTYGPSVMATYAFCLIYFLMIIFLMAQQKDKMNPKRRSAVMTWIILWFGAAIIQFIDNRLLIIGFAGAVGVMVIYLVLENPETNRNRETGLFNATAFMQYVKQLSSKNEDFGLVALVFQQTYELRTFESPTHQLEIDVMKFVSSISEIYAFQCRENVIILVAKPEIPVSEVEEMLRKYLEYSIPESHKTSDKPRYLVMPSTQILKSPEDILPFLTYVQQDKNAFVEEDRLLLNADIAQNMYKEQEIELLIADAIKSDRIEVYYQPIYSTKEKRFTSAEALCRIFTKDGKMIPPGEFIEIAESNGMILKLGEVVFEKVCQFLQSGEPQKAGIEYVEVNLSVVQCSNEFLAQRFIHIMEQYHIQPSQINLEITETGIAGARRNMIDNMRQLIDYGIQFSLDDFGTGHSNLNNIVDMPVNIVKFDRSMTNSYFNDRKAKYVMDAAMHMIHGMELRIVSEGIETREQLETMEQLDINYIQGFYFSKPLPQSEFLEFLNTNNTYGNRRREDA